MRIRLLHNKINGTIADGGSLGLSAIGRFLCVLTQRNRPPSLRVREAVCARSDTRGPNDARVASLPVRQTIAASCCRASIARRDVACIGRRASLPRSSTTRPNAPDRTSRSAALAAMTALAVHTTGSAARSTPASATSGG